MFEGFEVPIAKRGLWHKVRRFFLAKPICSIVQGGDYVLAYYWRDGTCEVMKFGKAEPGSVIEVPAGTEVRYEITEEA